MNRNMQKDNHANFLLQGSVLAIASIISRIIGLLYRIPLTAIIGDVGNNYYGCAFDIYTMMLLISSCSLPLAVSKMVSARVSRGEIKNAYKVFQGAVVFALVTGTIACFLVYFGASLVVQQLVDAFNLNVKIEINDKKNEKIKTNG